MAIQIFLAMDFPFGLDYFLGCEFCPAWGKFLENIQDRTLTSWETRFFFYKVVNEFCCKIMRGVTD
jgi:hypothetical protein